MTGIWGYDPSTTTLLPGVQPLLHAPTIAPPPLLGLRVAMMWMFRDADGEPLLAASDESGPADPDGVDGDALMAAWRGGDDAAFARIVDVFGPALLRFLRRQLGDVRKAEDAWSETFYRVVRARDAYVPEGHFRAWIFSIARRCGLDQMRSQRRVRRLVNRLVEKAIPSRRQPAPEVEALQSERARQLAVAQQALSEDQRVLLLLTYQEGLPSDEIGRVMGLSGQQVRNRTSYARRLLAEQLENPWEEGSSRRARGAGGLQRPGR